MTSDNTDLTRFKKEVLYYGAESCLPKNLSHYWLDRLSMQANTLLVEEHSVEEQSCPEIFAALIFLLFHKNQPEAEIQVSLEELFKHCQHYAIELSLEEVHRKTNVKYEAATLDTILTERRVKVSYE